LQLVVGVNMMVEAEGSVHAAERKLRWRWRQYVSVWLLARIPSLVSDCIV